MKVERLFLIGFSYTGKTQSGRRAAEILRWSYVDTDALIVEKAGKAIPQIFAEDGEKSFRQIERQVLKDVCRRKNLVVATGGGIVLDEDNRSLMARKGAVICLEAQPETIYRRLLKDAEVGSSSVVRPLLQGDEPLERIRHLKEFRQPFYTVARWTVHTDNLSLEEAAEEIVRGLAYAGRGGPAPAGIKGTRSESEAPYCTPEDAGLVVRTASASYPVCLHPLAGLGPKMRHLELKGTAFVISDENVFAHHGRTAEESLAEAGFRVSSYCIAPGEDSKSLEVLRHLYDWLLGQKAERGHAIVAMGGGVVGDLAGLAAATLLRGIPYVQVPTSLLAMVDSSVGGKTAINHPAGKNLIGAFYQPRLVLVDVSTLRTLPPRELTSGWAEVIKHGLIRDAAYFQFLRKHSGQLLALEDEPTRKAILRSIGIKAEVVGRDERETTGERSLLNYGHTIAHGLEAAAGYGHFLHGEAVAIGMAGAARISQEMGLLSAEKAAAQNEALQAYGLPTRATGADRNQVIRAMSLDKKVTAGKVRWALLDDIGHAVLRDDVPATVVTRALDQVLS